MQAGGCSLDCDWCGKTVDPHDDACLQLTCNASCHAPKECSIYHEKCIKQYLRGCSGKNYDPSRKSGFPCPRGLGKAKSTKCRGKITHMQRCITKSKPGATPVTVAPAVAAKGNKKAAGAGAGAAAKAPAEKPVGAKAAAAAAACAAARQPKVIKAVQVHKPLTTTASCKSDTAPAATAASLDSRPSLQSASSINSSSSASDTATHKPESFGCNTLAAALAVASRAAKTNAKRTAAKVAKQDVHEQDLHQQQTPFSNHIPPSSEAHSIQDSICSSSTCGSASISSTCGSATTISRPSTSVTSTDTVSAADGTAASTSTSMSCLVEWGSTCTATADASCSNGIAAVDQDEYAYIDSDSEAGEVLQWSPTHDEPIQPQQQLTQQHDTQQHHIQQRHSTQHGSQHLAQQQATGVYSLFGDSGLAGGLAGLAAVVPNDTAAAGLGCTGPASAVLPPSNQHMMHAWTSQPLQPHLQQLTALQQAQLQYQQYKLQQHHRLVASTAALSKQPAAETAATNMNHYVQRQQEEHVHWAGATQTFGANLGHALSAAAEYDATDEELLALLMP